MQLLDKILNYFKGAAAQSIRYNFVPVGVGVRKTVQADGDLAFATCIEILAKYMGRVSWNVYGRDNKELIVIMARYGRCLNVQPYSGVNAFDFWYYMETQRQLYGNAYAYIDTDNAGVLRNLVPLDAACVTLLWDDKGLLTGDRKLFYQYIDSRIGADFILPAEQVFHVKAHSVNGLVGRRAGAVLAQALSGNAEVESALRTTVTTGFSGSILLNFDSDLNDAKQRAVQEKVKKLMVDSDSVIIPLPPGLKATNIPNNVKDYYEILRKANAEAISAFFGIPLMLLNIGDGAGVGAFSTNQMTQFFLGTIQPIISEYALELSAKLLTNRQMGYGYHFDSSADVFDFLDAQSKASVLSAYVGGGILTPNEARASILYPMSDDPLANRLTQRGGGLLGDSAANEGGKNNEGNS